MTKSYSILFTDLVFIYSFFFLYLIILPKQIILLVNCSRGKISKLESRYIRYVSDVHMKSWLSEKPL